MPQAKLIFIRGLNTHTVDGVYLGPLNLGPADQYLRQKFEEAGIGFISIRNIGSGSLSSQVQKAKVQLLSELAPNESVFLLGHSQGGLIARAISHDHDIANRILAVTTIATPHHGSLLADAAMKLRKTNPLAYWACRIGKYDTEKKLDDFRNVSTSFAKGFNKTNPIAAGIPHYSVVCSMPQKKLPLSLQILPRIAKATELTDGMVPESSQAWGSVLAKYELDHLSQLGYFTHLNPRSRRKAKADFADMINMIVNCFKKAIETR